MRVCLLTQAFVRYQGDPIGSFVFRLAEGLGERGVAVSVVAPHASGLPAREVMGRTEVTRFRYAPQGYERLAYQGIMHRLVQESALNKILLGSFLASFVTTAVMTVRRHQADLIHAHWWFPSGVVGGLVSAITGVPLIITCHGTDVHLLSMHPLMLIPARWAFRRASAVTVVSNHLREDLLRYLPQVEHALSVVPMPIDRAFTKPCPPIQRAQTGPPIVIGAGRLSWKKGFQDLIVAVHRLQQDGISVRLLLIGEGEEEQELRELSRHLHVEDRVTFMPFQDPENLAALYCSSEAVVLPSYEEGLGLTLVEAMFCQVPVIGALSGGIRDLIVDGETGLLVPPGDPDALAIALKRILWNRDLGERLARAGRAFVHSAYDPEACIDKMLAIYQAVV